MSFSRDRRVDLLLAPVTAAMLGFTLGLPVLRSLLAFPLQRIEAFTGLPRPISTLWWDRLHRLGRSLDDLERLIVAASLVLILLVCLWLVRALIPGFSLRRRFLPDGSPAPRSHVDVPKLLRGGLGALLTLWLAGALAPIGQVLSGPVRGSVSLTRLLGGLPAWVGSSVGPLSVLLLSLCLFLVLWLIWGPIGIMREQSQPVPNPGDTFFWGAAAGLAAVPGVAALYLPRPGLTAAATAYSLADRQGWVGLLIAAVALPAAGMIYLTLVTFVFRPGRVETTPRHLYVIGALMACGLGCFGADRSAAALRSLDVGAGLARRLNLPPSPLRRYALIAVPGDRVAPSSPDDGSDDGNGRDRVACSGTSVRAVEEYLRQHGARSGLADRAFFHLQACASLDWLSTLNLRTTLECLERSPSPLTVRLLLEKLEASPVTRESRAVLDRLADPSRFRLPQPRGAVWLGRLYRRYGDLKKSRSYLLGVRGQDRETLPLLAGIAPLVSGTVQGELRVPGVRQEGVRLGLVPLDRAGDLIGIRGPASWRHVLDLTYTDARGRWQFSRVPEGDYLLILTGGGIGRDPGQPVLTPNPGVLHIDRFQPAVRVPSMVLSYIHSRAPQSGQTTVRRLIRSRPADTHPA